MPQFQMEVSLGGVILIIGQIILFISFIWKRSGAESEQRGRIETNTSRLAALEVQVDARAKQIELAAAARAEQVEMAATARAEQLDTELTAKLSALQGTINLTRDQHHELREHLAVNYMKREEINAMERRVTDGQTALKADISKLDTKLDQVLKTVLDAIAGIRK
jgi:chromosome segregation ATPase